MQRKVIAVAVAGLISGAAFAQSNVTIYGVMDAYGARNTAQNATGNQTQTAVGSGGLGSSRLGFMGEEELGNGLKAIFKLELGSLTIDGATNSIGNTREAWVGMKSDTLGTAYMGRIQTLGYYWSQKYDPFAIAPAFSLMSVIGRNYANLLISASSNFARMANSVSYISPNFSGVTVRADASAGEQVTGTNGAAGFKNAQAFYALGADYDNGPLSVGLAMAQVNNANGTLNNTNDMNIRDWALGGTYDFAVVKAFLNYQESKLSPTAGADVKSTMWNTGVRIPVAAAGAVRLGYSQYKNDQTNAVKSNAWAVSYEHAFSKRTIAYVGYQGINNGTFAAFSSGAPSNSVVPSLDKNASSYVIGLRHNF